MPVTLQCEDFLLTTEEVSRLWQEALSACGHEDEAVIVRCVDSNESKRLNRDFRGKDRPTNVLTFSLPLWYLESDQVHVPRKDETVEHNVALCIEVAKSEAQMREAELRGYIAALLTHAFLHAVGVHHEGSDSEAKRMRELESKILEKSGFSPIRL